MANQGIAIGNVKLTGRVFLAPMAGFSDLPYRRICRSFGAAYAPGEMVASQANLRKTSKSSFRFKLGSEEHPRAIQLLGANENDLAETARFAIECGAEIIDFNGGCPAKKVCSADCGAALLKEPEKLFKLLGVLVESSSVPVTLKFRTGWDQQHKNAVEVAKVAEGLGIQMLTLHGRTASDAFKGAVDYLSIKQVKEAVRIPVVANGDIDTGVKAKEIVAKTGADAVMIGRAALGNPWIFREIDCVLKGVKPPKVTKEDIAKTINKHVETHLSFYGEANGLRSIRKHLIWYFKRLNLETSFVTENIQVTDGKVYLSRLSDYLDLKLSDT